MAHKLKIKRKDGLGYWELPHMDEEYIDELTFGGDTALHTHDQRYYTEIELDGGVLDARYYTETEIDAELLNYLLIDGSRELTGDWYAGPVDITIGNNRYYAIKNTGGDAKNMVYLTASNIAYLSHADFATNVQGSTVTIRSNSQDSLVCGASDIQANLPVLIDIGATPTESQQLIQANDAGAISLLCYTHNNASIAFGAKYESGGWVSESTHAMSISSANAMMNFYGMTGQTPDTALGTWQTNMAIDLATGQVIIKKGTGAITINGNMGAGLTINQGTADNEFFAGKSSDVNHLCASITETDTYAFMKKIATVLGGLNITGIGGDGANTTTIQLNGYGGTADTTKSTAGRGLCEINLYEHTGAGGVADITASGNIVAIRAQVSSSLQSRWICDEDGKTWQAGDVKSEGNLDIDGTWDLGAVLTTNETYRGKTILVDVDDSGVVFGHVLASAADFNYDRADADAAANCVGLVMALEAGTGSDKKVLVEGMVCDTDWAWTNGYIYLSTTAGELTQTAPSGTGDQVVAVGWALSATCIYFKPSLVLVEVA